MAQIIRPGAPVLFGGAPATFHMKIASSPMAAIEALQLDAAYVAVAKALDLPCQSYMALSDGPILDAQAGAETFGSALIAALAGRELACPGPGCSTSCSSSACRSSSSTTRCAARRSASCATSTPIDDLPVGPLIDQLMADQHLIMAEHTMAHWPTELYLPVRRSSTATTASNGRSSGRRTRTSAPATTSTGGSPRTGRPRRTRASTRSCAGSSGPASPTQTELPVIPPAAEPTAEALAATAGPVRRRNLRRGG